MPPRVALTRAPRWVTRSANSSHPVRRISGRAAFAYTWLTKTPEAISPDDIVSSCSSSSPELRLSNPDPSALLFLVTPRFAHWLDPSSSFLEKCVRDLYPSSSVPNPLYTIAAIVDKIPDPATQFHPQQRESHPMQEEYEGISILAVAPENVRGKVAPKRRIGAPPNEEPNLLFSIRDEQTPQAAAHEIGLRLTNTIFINGKENTLLGMRWTRPHALSDESLNNYTLDQSVDLTSCVFESTSQAIYPHLDLPLDPVSQRRRVITSMGNILRQIAKSTDATSTAPMPASSELEKELPSYIAENNIVDQRVSVWALVEKPDVEIAGQDLSTQDRLAESLRRGGKLHRVMSGGGGWGKKQGLLSLDPEVSFPGSARRIELVGLDDMFNPNSEIPSDMAPTLDEIMGGDDLSNLSQVAREGDFIQFFVSVEPTTAHGKLAQTHKPGDVTYCFGAVSAFEEIDTQCLNEERKSLVPMPNTFGALSEKAITYSQPVAQGGNLVESSTKLDIPGSRVILSPVK